ncbi:MAG: hypothetical protein MJE68_21695, partial [Proteobacteria bacterium]|nr:hypothetical protein [Pseudomonadota bacterium]
LQMFLGVFSTLSAFSHMHVNISADKLVIPDCSTGIERCCFADALDLLFRDNDRLLLAVSLSASLAPTTAC